MALYRMTEDDIAPLSPTQFAKEKVKERYDLQRVLRDHIEVLAEDVMVLAEEFAGWQQSHRRIDLLGLDRDARLVVFELKRTEDGGHMELQAIRYAAMVSSMTFDQAVSAHEVYLKQRGRQEDARQAILDFLEWEEPDEDQFAADVRIVLVSADFSREITSTVLWLNDRGLDIRCVRLQPYRHGDDLLLDIQQILPLPEAEEYQVRLKEKSQRQRAYRWTPKTMESIVYEFRKNHPEEVVTAVLSFRDWLEEQCGEVFTTTDAFAPYLPDRQRNQFLLKVSYRGFIEFWFVHLAKKPPFADPGLREELRRRLNRIPGADIGPDRITGKPKIPIRILTDPEATRLLKEAVAWAIEVIRAPDA